MRFTATVLVLLVLSPFTRPFKTIDLEMVSQTGVHQTAPAGPEINRLTGDTRGFGKFIPARWWHLSAPYVLVLAPVWPTTQPGLNTSVQSGVDSRPPPHPSPSSLAALRI